MSLEDALSKLTTTKKGILNQRAPVDKVLESVFNKMIDADLQKFIFRISIDRKYYTIEFYYDYGRPSSQGHYDDNDTYYTYRKLSDCWGDGEQSGKQLRPIPDDLKPFNRHIIIWLHGFSLNKGGPLILLMRTATVQGGWLSKKEITPKGVGIFYRGFGEEFPGKDMSSEEFFAVLPNIYHGNIESALDVSRFIVLMRNVERYIAYYLETISKATKAVGADMRMDTIEIPNMMMKCRSCGAPNPDNDDNCIYCGSALRDIKPIIN